MGFKKNNPGCNCCGCSLGEDDFNRADNTDPGTKWTEVSGTGGIASNAYAFTSAGIILFNKLHPSGGITLIPQVDFKHSNSGSACDILFCVTDPTHFYYARYIVQGASGSISIRRNNGGSHSTIKTVSATLNTNTFYTGKVCVDDAGNATAYLNGVAYVTAAAGTSGAQVGLGCSGSGTATFDNFSLVKSHSSNSLACDHCVNVNCTSCGSGTPFQMQLTVPAGTVSNVSPCTSCAADLEGVFVCDLLGPHSFLPHCQWRSPVIPVCSITAYWQVLVSAGAWQMVLRRASDDLSLLTFSRLEPGPPYDCKASRSFNFSATSGSSPCSSSVGKTVTLNAIL